MGGVVVVFMLDAAVPGGSGGRVVVSRGDHYSIA